MDENMAIKEKEDDIDQLLQARSEIDEELQRHKTRQTVLFTDIVGSTTYFDRFGDTEGLLLLYQHDSLVKAVVEEFKGTVIKTIGDSVMAEFADTLPAVHAAIAIQRHLMDRNESLPRNKRLHIRIGIHTGFGFRRANDLFGDIVNVAARITKCSGPAQILVSQSVVESIPAREVFFKSLGPVSLEGKIDAEEIFEAYWADGAIYDAIRSSFTAFSAPVGAESRGILNDDTAIFQMRLKVLRAFYAIRLASGQFIAKVHATPVLSVAKTTLALTVYAAIAAGIVSGRADTKQPSIPEAPPPQKTVKRGPISIETPEIMVYASLPLTAVAVPYEGSISNSDAASTSMAPAVAPLMDIHTADRKQNWATFIETAPIPSGIFMMGSDFGKGDEKPRHQVRLDEFNISRAEITNRQYTAFLMDTGYPRPKDPGFAKNYLVEYPNLPVVNVSYDDAIAFCAWASKKLGATVRLPSEAEWEYAALAGRNGVSFPWGPQDPNSLARFKGNAPIDVKTAASDAFPPNSYGLYNMTGNVWEWVEDYYSKDYYTTSPIRNPKGPADGTKHTIRGGSWADDGSTLRVTRRAGRNPNERSDQIGFRVVVSSNRQELKSVSVQ